MRLIDTTDEGALILSLGPNQSQPFLTYGLTRRQLILLTRGHHR